MTATADSVEAGEFRLTPRPKFRMQPLRAWRAVRKLIADKEDTAQVFEILAALSGQAIPKGYQRLISTNEGGRIAYRMEEFAEYLSDRAWLESFGPGTVGAAYRDFVAPRGLTAEGLAEESRKVKDSEIDAPHPHAWYARRLRDVHDVWHVLTGYQTDGFGEACLLAFSYKQTRSLGLLLIIDAARREYAKLKLSQPYAEALKEGFRNGAKSAWLPALDYPALFAENLESARRRLKIEPPVIYRSIPADYRDRIGGGMQPPQQQMAA